MAVSRVVSERLHSLKDLSALIFFSSIGASLPIVSDTPLIAIALGVALLVVLVKFFGFSISSWILGLKIEDSFRLGLYMLAISEFGVIIAKDAAESGVASQSFYLVSVIALAASAILSSSLVKFEDAIPKKLSGLIPPAFRLNIERISAILKDAMRKQSSALIEVKEALWELMRRIAIISLVVFGANLALAYVTPLLPLTIRPPMEVAITVSTVILVFSVAIRMKKMFRRLGRGVAMRMGDPRRRIEDIVAGFLYAVTIGVASVAMIIVSFAQIERALTMILSKEGTSVVVLTLIAFILVLLYRYTLAAVRRLERTFQIEE